MIKYYLLIICFLFGLIIVMTIYPLYPGLPDTAKFLFMGKLDAGNISNIFYTKESPENVRLYGSSIYRYFFRLINALLFKFWGTNFIYMYLLYGLFFILILTNIYCLGYLLENKWIGFISAILFLSLKDIYYSLSSMDFPFLMGGFFYTTSMIFFLLTFKRNKNIYLFLGILNALFACGSKENAYYIVSLFLIVLALNNYYNKSISSFKRNIMILFVFILLILFLRGKFIQHHQQLLLRSIFKLVPTNLKTYNAILLDNFGIGWLSVISIAVIKGKSRNMPLYILWVIVAFIPLLLWFFGSSTYLYDVFIGISFIGGIGVYTILLMLVKSYNKFYKRQLLSNLVIIIILFCLIFQFYNTIQKRLLTSFKYRNSENIILKNSIDELVHNTCLNQKVLVPMGRGEYCEYMAKFFDRNDLIILELNGNMIKEVSESSNLLSNANFERGLESWVINSKDNILVDNDEKEGKQKIVRITDKFAPFSHELIDIIQEVPVQQNTSYLFGGWIKTVNINQGGVVRIEIQDNRGWKFGTWKTKDIYGTSDWSLEFSTFENKTGTKIKFICCRTLFLTRGGAYFKDVFLHKLKYKYINFSS